MQLTPWSNVRSIAIAEWGKPRLESTHGVGPIATPCSGASEQIVAVDILNIGEKA